MKNLKDELYVNTIRFLAVDAVEQAYSGHPGLPLGASPMAFVLWDKFLRYNPKNPNWLNRDRFILSAGHGSAMLYALLHLYGYDLPLEELKRFRQWGSKTPGHPEYGLVPGIEVTTGPLGQGFAMGVGIAMAESFLAKCFNRPDFPLIDHHTYAIVSDGDLMEGVASEAASLAGTLKLSKLIYLYDDNHISIEGDTDIAFTENVKDRFEAYGWNVLRVPDGNNLVDVESAIRIAQAEKVKPTLIIVRTHIGYGSPKQDTAGVHGSPLGSEALLKTKENLGWPTEPSFYIPDDSLNHFRQAILKGEMFESEWRKLLKEFRREYPSVAEQVDLVMKGQLPDNWKSKLPQFHPQDGSMATRSASGKALNSLAIQLPHFILGGSADLSPSTKTLLMGYGDFGFGDYCGSNVHFGVREHAMGAIANGMSLHSGLVTYTATFLVFSDYMRPALRLAALMQSNVIFVFTHDSIAVGEDGPTHEPVEHVMSLRTIPGMTVIRPADANETTQAWRVAIERRGPVSLILTRQKLPILDLERYPIVEGFSKGAYILSEVESSLPEIILIATGSEVSLALDSKEALKAKGVKARVVSMPSWELFEEQSVDYKNRVLLPDIPKLAIEAGVTLGWQKYAKDVIGLDRFGESAPGSVVYEKLGFNVNNVMEHSLKLLNK